jgi:hypothetical protein
MGEGGTIPFMAMLGEKFPQAQFVGGAFAAASVARVFRRPVPISGSTT